MKGHLHLVCSHGENGACFLSKQSFRAPIHLSKPHEDAGALVVNLVNPTAGIFDDDEIDIKVTVETGASMVLASPSATRVYRSRSGNGAMISQSFHVHEGGSLEVYPEPFIPHGGARSRQSTDILVAPGGRLAFYEWLTPGRVASGETFQFSELEWNLDLWAADKLVAREHYSLSPENSSLHPLQMFSETAQYIGCFVQGFEIDASEIDAMESSDVYIGCCRLAHEGWVIKAICADSLAARRVMKKLREKLYAAQHKPLPWLGRF